MSAGAPCTSPRTALYRRRQPERTVLYRTVQGHLASWLELTRDSASGTSVPAYVEREFRRYLDCGILAHCFVRARCGQCGHDFLTAFSCKGRGVCPACNARRMVETAAPLADFPRLPVRQWVLSVPKRLRYYLQNDAAVQTLALHIFLSAVEQSLRRCSPGAGPASRIGAVAFIHGFGALLNAHVHFHCVVIKGVVEADAAGGARFHAARGVGPEIIADIQAKVRARLQRALARRGLLEREDAEARAPGITVGVSRSMRACASRAHDGQGLGRLLRYCARPAFALERLREIDPQHLVYESVKPGPGGSVSLILTPLELLDRLTALIPPPRRHRHRYFGVLAPNAPLRSAVTALNAPRAETSAAHTPAAAAAAPPPAPASASAETAQAAEEPIRRRAARYAWALLLARIYEAFPLLCPKCGGEMRIIAFISEAPAVREILTRIWASRHHRRAWHRPVARRCGRWPMPATQTPNRHPTVDQRIAWWAPRQSKPPLPSVPAHGATRAWAQPSGKRRPLG